MNPQIPPEEHLRRLTSLQRRVKERDLDMFIVSSLESIFYLTGAGFEPLERPFFLLVAAEGPPILLVPKLDQEHMTKVFKAECRITPGAFRRAGCDEFLTPLNIRDVRQNFESSV